MCMLKANEEIMSKTSDEWCQLFCTHRSSMCGIRINIRFSNVKVNLTEQFWLSSEVKA